VVRLTDRAFHRACSLRACEAMLEGRASRCGVPNFRTLTIWGLMRLDCVRE
jgi:hypothetical protein